MVEGSGCHLEQFPLEHWQPVKNFTKNQGDVVELSIIDDQPSSSVQQSGGNV